MKRAHWMSTTGFTLLASGAASFLAVTPSMAQSAASPQAAASATAPAEVLQVVRARGFRCHAFYPATHP